MRHVGSSTIASGPGRVLRGAGAPDFDHILGLQTLYVRENVPEDNREQGFLSVEFSRRQLEEINEGLGIHVCCESGELVAYLVATTLAYGAQFPIVETVIRRTRGLWLHGRRVNKSTSFVYGPVCIHEQYRGQEILQALFKRHVASLRNYHYRTGITFISRYNLRSLNAHVRKLGMTIIDEVDCHGELFHILAFDLPS